jgi:hypothetical protein
MIEPIAVIQPNKSIPLSTAANKNKPKGQEEVLCELCNKMIPVNSWNAHLYGMLFSLTS